MGVALYVQGYKKDTESITGQIKLLGWYEVNSQEIDKHKIADSSTVIHDDLKSIELARKEFWNFGFENSGELAFYNNIANNMDGNGYRYENGESFELMFDGGKIYSIINRILQSIDSLSLDSTEKENEKNNLAELQTVLKVISEQDGIVGMVWG